MYQIYYTVVLTVDIFQYFGIFKNASNCLLKFSDNFFMGVCYPCVFLTCQTYWILKGFLYDDVIIPEKFLPVVDDWMSTMIHIGIVFPIGLELLFVKMPSINRNLCLLLGPLTTTAYLLTLSIYKYTTGSWYYGYYDDFSAFEFVLFYLYIFILPTIYTKIGMNIQDKIVEVSDFEKIE